MSDRFKFRVWDKLDEEYYDENCFQMQIESSGDLFIIGVGNDGEDCFWETDNTVVEQCTGLKDKNGKLIYDGDIVIKSDVSAIGYSRTRVCKVHWHNDWLSWAITTQYGDTYELSEFEPQQYEVIGNIHTENINDM